MKIGLGDEKSFIYEFTDSILDGLKRCIVPNISSASDTVLSVSLMDSNHRVYHHCIDLWKEGCKSRLSAMTGYYVNLKNRNKINTDPPKRTLNSH